MLHPSAGAGGKSAELITAVACMGLITPAVTLGVLDAPFISQTFMPSLKPLPSRRRVTVVSLRYIFLASCAGAPSTKALVIFGVSLTISKVAVTGEPASVPLVAVILYVPGSLPTAILPEDAIPSPSAESVLVTAVGLPISISSTPVGFFV